MNPTILWYYRWVDGVSLRIGAVTRDGKTLYGPVPPSPQKKA